MLLKNMKNSKVIENNLIFLLAFLFCCPLQALTNPVSFCSKKLTSLECINGHITLRYPDPEAEDIFFLEGQFIYDEKEYSFSTRRPVFSMESCFDTMEKIKFITSSGQFCVQAEDRFEDDDYVTLEGFFSSKGKWTYFENYEASYYEDYTEPICACLDLEEEGNGSHAFLNSFIGFDFFSSIKTINSFPKRSVCRFQTKTVRKDRGFIDRLLKKVFNFLN